MSCPACRLGPTVPEENQTLPTDRFCRDCGLESLAGDKFCRQCGLRFDTAPRPSALDRFCRQCGARQNEAAQNSAVGKERKPFWNPMQASRVRETHTVLIAAMWVLTAASWVSWLALELKAGIILDLLAVIMALALSFLPSWTDRINGWSKLGIEAANLAYFAFSIWHQ